MSVKDHTIVIEKWESEKTKSSLGWTRGLFCFLTMVFRCFCLIYMFGWLVGFAIVVGWLAGWVGFLFCFVFCFVLF